MWRIKQWMTGGIWWIPEIESRCVVQRISFIAVLGPAFNIIANLFICMFSCFFSTTIKCVTEGPNKCQTISCIWFWYYIDSSPYLMIHVSMSFSTLSVSAINAWMTKDFNNQIQDQPTHTSRDLFLMPHICQRGITLRLMEICKLLFSPIRE